MGGNKSEKRKRGNIGITLDREDLEQLRQDASKSTCRTVTAYCRKLLLGKPVRVLYRSQSFDAFIEEAIALRKEMETLRQAGTLASADVERLIAVQEEIKKCINKIYDHVSHHNAHQKDS